MSVTCPAGHESETVDYCDVCGLRIVPAGEAQPSPMAIAEEREPEPDSDVLVRDEPPPASPCPNCGEPNGPDSRFCEDCGFDLASAPPTDDGPTTWEAVVLVDRGFYDELDPDGIAFPDTTTERRVPLSGECARIGRRRHSSPDGPEIDLAGPPEDTGVSHHHAELVNGEDGWSLLDCGSTNGTFLNDLAEPLAPGQPVAVHDGDRIHVGAWTTIVIERATPAATPPSRDG